MMHALGLGLLTVAAGAPEGTPPSVTTEAPVATPQATKAPPPAFGDAGMVVLDDLLGIGFGPGITASALQLPLSAPRMTGWLEYDDASSDGGPQSYRFSTIAAAPALDVFVARQFSIGAQASVFHSQSRLGVESSVVGAGLRPRVGWVVPITDGLYFWPRAFGLLQITYAKETGAGSPTGATVLGAGNMTGVAWGLGGDAMLIAPLGRTVALTFGPTIEYDKAHRSGGGGTTSSVSFAVHGGIALTL